MRSKKYGSFTLMLGLLIGASELLGVTEFSIKFPRSIFDVMKTYKSLEERHHGIPAIMKEGDRFKNILLPDFGFERIAFFKKAEKEKEAVKIWIAEPYKSRSSMIPNQQIVIRALDEKTKQDSKTFLLASVFEQELILAAVDTLLEELKKAGNRSKMVENKIEELLVANAQIAMDDLKFKTAGEQVVTEDTLERLEPYVKIALETAANSLKLIFRNVAEGLREIEKEFQDEEIGGLTASQVMEDKAKVEPQIKSIVENTMRRLKPKFKAITEDLQKKMKAGGAAGIVDSLTVGDFMYLYQKLYKLKGLYLLDKRLIEKAKSFPLKLGAQGVDEPLMVITSEKAKEILDKKRGDLVFVDDKVVVVDEQIFRSVHWMREFFRRRFGY